MYNRRHNNIFRPTVLSVYINVTVKCTLHTMYNIYATNLESLRLHKSLELKTRKRGTHIGQHNYRGNTLF